ncbi:MAG: choice-of-anchor N protein [candidate division Zixibacteria bacterium]|nr:choice-of-anchor N protein [candidate division Zixibacteria bacterium]
MKKTLLLIAITIFLAGSSAFAIPDLQLFIADATYDQASDTWVTNSPIFDLYIIGANTVMSNVMVSMALNLPQVEDPNGSVAIGVNGTPYNSWTYGTPNLLPPHGIYPAWYNQFNSGNYGLVGGVGMTIPPSLYNPATQGYLNPCPGHPLGEFKKFTISISGTDYAHFDGFFYFGNNNGNTKIKFAPFSKDAEYSAVPEPATLALFGLGTLGMGIVRKFRK